MVSFPLLTPPASSPSPDRQDARRPRSRNPSTWTVEDVVWFVKDADPQALGPHVELFRKHVSTRTHMVGLAWEGLGGVQGAWRKGEVWGAAGCRGDWSKLSPGPPLKGGQMGPQASHFVLFLRRGVCPICFLISAFIRSACFAAHPSLCLRIQQTFIAHLQYAKL